MAKVHAVVDGDCVSSIAERSGHFWQTLARPAAHHHVRRLLPEAFVITGAAAQELVYLEKVRFVRPIEAGDTVQLSVLFLEALPDDDDLVAVRLGVSLHTVDEELPVFVAEVSLLCGNPPVGDDDATLVLRPRRGPG